MEFADDVSAWDALARFVAYGGIGCTLTSDHSVMSMANSRAGVDGALEEFLSVFIHASERNYDCVMY